MGTGSIIAIRQATDREKTEDRALVPADVVVPGSQVLFVGKGGQHFQATFSEQDAYFPFSGFRVSVCSYGLDPKGLKGQIEQAAFAFRGALHDLVKDLTGHQDYPVDQVVLVIAAPVSCVPEPDEGADHYRVEFKYGMAAYRGLALDTGLSDFYVGHVVPVYEGDEAGLCAFVAQQVTLSLGFPEVV